VAEDVGTQIVNVVDPNLSRLHRRRRLWNCHIPLDGRSVIVRTRALLLAVSVLVSGVLAVGGTAGAQTTPTTSAVGPHQHFLGLVNGKSTKATIAVACPVPISAGETGHPVGGTLAVEPPATVAATSGNTGSRGRSVVATFVLPEVTPAANSALTFIKYGSKAIPNTVLLPCSGSGTVSPEPTSKTAQSTTVTMSYGNITVDPPTSVTTQSAANRTITVTRTDSGRSYRLHKGDALDVQLSGSSGFTWTEPASSDQAVLQRTRGASGTSATGTFVANAKGRAQVTAIGTPTCSRPCPTDIVAFQVSVTVVG
jgi:hypothetical protein